MFSKDGSNEISDKYVAVKLLGGDDLDDEGKAVSKRYAVRGFPTMLGLDSNGAVLQSSFPRSTEGILTAMEAAGKAKEKFAEKLKAFEAKKDDADAQRDMADLYIERRQMEEARPLLEGLAKKGEADDLIKLMSCLSALEDKEAANSVMDTLIEKFPEHEQYASWRITKAIGNLPKPQRGLDQEENIKRLTKIIESVEPLLKDTKEMHHHAIHGQLMGMKANLGKHEETAIHAEWIIKHAPKSEHAPQALLMSAISAITKARSEDDLKAAERALKLFEQLAEEHPTTRPGMIAAQRGVPQAKQTVTLIREKQEAKAKEESAKEGDAEVEDGTEEDADKPKEDDPKK